MSSQKRKLSDFADGAPTSGSSGYTFDVSSQKRKRPDFVGDASTSGYKYDVFLSFRGPDTRLTIADVVYEGLVGAGISVFIDDKELPVAGDIGPEIERAIVDARIYVPILSKNYASSAWCLQELEHMVKCRKENAEREIVPIFYDVSPSDVRLWTGSYGEALLKHEGRYGEETVREWRKALMEVGNLSGVDARNARHGKLVNDLVRWLSIKLKKKQRVLPDHLVGIDDRVKDVVQWLDCGSLDVKYLVVHGMGGIGKTTLVKAVYNEIGHLYDGCSFLSNVRESSQIDRDIIRMQNKLLSDILKKPIDVHDVDNGINMIRERFCRKKVLIVLDDIDELEQLMKLNGNSDWLGPGSRIIVTTRNVGLLAFLPKERFAYEMKEMSTWHALQLFSKHAFGETLPPDDLETLSNEIVATTGRIPLALEASGSFLRGKSPKVWAETLERLMKVPDRRVQETLRISYEALSWEEKQIYLDIACFFNGEESTSAKYAWKGCDYSPESGLATLMDLSLLKIDHQNILRMHDLIRDFGREIVRMENTRDGGSRSRLWKREECLHVLREQVDDQRKSNVESLRLQSSEVTSQDLERLPNLRFLDIKGGNFVGDFAVCFAKLRWLSWRDCPAQFEATNFSPRNLAVLKLSESKIGAEWDGWRQLRAASSLKVLNLQGCSRLTRLPDLSAFSTLEALNIRGCQSLVEIGRSIGNLEFLTRLDVESAGIRELPNSIGELKNLENLFLSRCYNLTKLPDSIGRLESLLELNLSHTKTTELPDSIGNMRKLKVMRIGHSDIRRIPVSIGMVERLEELHAGNCVNLEGDIPSEIGSLSFLKILNLSHTGIRSVPTTINQLPLQELYLEGCHELTQIPKLPPSLIKLYVESRSLKTVPNLSNLTNLVDLIVSDSIEESLSNLPDANFIQTPNLKWVQRMFRLEQMKLVHKSIIAPPTKLASLHGLKQLVLSCFDLTQLLPSTLSMLKLINFNSLAEFSCRSDLKNLSSLELCKSWLMEIPLNRFGQLENLLVLTVSNCTPLVQLSCLSGLKELRGLCLLSCPKLVAIQGLIKLESLESIRIVGCSSLVSLPDLLMLKKLRTMEFIFCESLVSLPSLSRVAYDNCYLVVDRCDNLSYHNGPFRLYKNRRRCPIPVRL